MMTRNGACVLALALLAVACTPAAERNEDAVATTADNGSEADNAIADDATANEAEASKSILRPEIVAPEPAAPVLKPIELVVPFGTSGLKLDDEGRSLLDGLIAEPVVRTGGPITVSGHTDTRGSDGDNVAASLVRANLVRDYLVGKGIAADRITVVALGERRAIAPNANPDGSDDPEGRARNRRAEVKVDLPPAPPAEQAAAAPSAEAKDPPPPAPAAH
jgi:OOP family OmpA-OmpF porin